MSLRAIAALDRTVILGHATIGVGEDVRITKASGDPVIVKALWLQEPTDARTTHGIGVAGGTGRTSVELAAADAVGYDRTWQFQRIADGVNWEVEDDEPITGVGWRIFLTRPAQAELRRLR